MTRRLVVLVAMTLTGAVLAGVSCTPRPAESGGGPETVYTPAAASDQKSLLKNGSFDEGDGKSLLGWDQQGNERGSATLVTSPASSPPRALKMTVSDKGSTGESSFMVFQVLDAARYRGQRLNFGAKIRTQGAGVNLTLYTPEGSANVLHADLATKEWVSVKKALDVPRKASFLSLGIEVLGDAGGIAWLDDVYVTPAQAEKQGSVPGAAAPAAAGETVPATVAIDAARVTHEASPLIFGMHLEWVENGQGLLDPTRGTLRPEVLAALRPLRIPLFRFPGGIHADYYDWSLGVGTAGARGSGYDAFTRAREVMRFGTPEFIELLRATGAEALITLNYGTGTAAQAAAWARQFQASGVSPPYWEVGNEIYLSSPTEDQPNGKAIFKPADQYARDFPRFRDSVRAVFPGASVGAIMHLESGAFPLAPADNRDWSERMVRALSIPADFYAVHNAYAPVILDDRWDLGNATDRDEVYRAMYASREQVRENLDLVAAALARAPGHPSPIRIAVTEFAPFFGVSERLAMHNAYVDHTRTLAAALYTASILDLFLSDQRVFAAAYTNPIHKYYGTLLTDTDEQLVRTPTYYLYELYRTRFESRILQSTVQSPTFDSRTLGYIRSRSAVPDLLARASTSADGRRLTAMLVNRSAARTLTTTVSLSGFTPSAVDCLILNASSAAAINGPALTNTTVKEAEIAPRAFPCETGTSMSLSIPPNAVVSLVATR